MFADHSRKMAGWTVVYPVVSRRASGVSLGINLNPNGACNYKCAYCQVPRHQLDRRVSDPDPRRVLDELDRLREWVVSGAMFKNQRFDQTPEKLRVLRDISISGDGEPSLYARLDELGPEVMSRAQEWGCSFQMITNGVGLSRERDFQWLEQLRPGRDRLWLKADAWNDADMRDIYGLSSSYAEHRRMLEDRLSRFRCWLQICVFCRAGQRLSREDPSRMGQVVEGWRTKFELLERVQVYTLARQTWVEGVGALSDSEMRDWGKAFASQTRCPLSIYGSRGEIST